jgi:hypothetical protein
LTHPRAGHGAPFHRNATMKAEIEAVVSEIEQSLALLRRHL